MTSKTTIENKGKIQVILQKYLVRKANKWYKNGYSWTHKGHTGYTKYYRLHCQHTLLKKRNLRIQKEK